MAAMLFVLKLVKCCLKGKEATAVCPEMSLLRVSAKLFPLKERARRAVGAQMSLLKYTSRAVCTERKRQPSCLS
jgi:hypothetical protein